MSKKQKEIAWIVTQDLGLSKRIKEILAKTPEGAVKKFFGRQNRLPSVTIDGGWKGITVCPKNGYTRVYN